MVHDHSLFPCDDGALLSVRRWKPDQRPLAVVHILHGMAEHAGRYGRLAEVLCGKGIEVWAADQRGHGKTADLSVNTVERGGLLGHCADRDTFERVACDARAINAEIRKSHPGVPLFLLGHSWGSFIAQHYIETMNHGEGAIDGCVLSGTRGPCRFKVQAGLPLLRLLALLYGNRRKAPLSHLIIDGSYNRPFRPNRTVFDWLSRDDAEVDAYVNDPLCGNVCSSGFYRDLDLCLCRIHTKEAMAQVDKNLPIYIFSGNQDPVGDMGESPTALVNAYRSLGILDLEFVLYPDARHEAFNETNREEVVDNLLDWICRHTEPGN